MASARRRRGRTRARSILFFFSSRRRHTRLQGDWSSDVCSSDLPRPDRNLSLELVRVTEAAAMGAGRWIGRGDKMAADQAAVDAMRAMLDTVAKIGRASCRERV